MKTRLNLLPPKEKKRLKTALTMTFVQSLTTFVLLMSVLITGTLISLRYVMQDTVNDLTRKSTESLDEHEAISQYIQNINDFIKRTDEIHSEFTDWSAVLEMLGHSAPDGLVFDTVSVDTDSHVVIEGEAESRDDVLRMKTLLKQTPEFVNIQSPLSNILKKEDAQFQFLMDYKPNAGE